MKFTVDLPSAVVGAGISMLAVMAATSPLLAPLHLFDYSGRAIIWVAGGLIVLAAASLLPQMIGKIGARPKEWRERLKDKFPTAIEGLDTTPSMGSVEWAKTAIGKHGGSLENAIRKEFERQVWRYVDSEISDALRIAFCTIISRAHDPNVADQPGGSARKSSENPSLNELAIRMEDHLKSGKPFDLEGYKRACVSLGYGRMTEPPKMSPFDVIDLALLFKRVKTMKLVASAEFVWLKELDRQLWYVLNGVGRSAFHPESLGAMAHMQEQEAVENRFLLLQPKVDRAVNGLLEHFDTIGVKFPEEVAG